MRHSLRYSDRMKPVLLHGFVLLAFVLGVASSSSLGGTTNPAGSEPVPVIDGELGHCSVEFTVTDADGRLAAGAKIRVRIAYGFMSLRKLDLEVGTNTEGKARFEGLPDKTKRALEFRSSQGNLEGSAVYDPGESCKAQRTIVLQPVKP